MEKDDSEGVVLPEDVVDQNEVNQAVEVEREKTLDGDNNFEANAGNALCCNVCINSLSYLMLMLLDDDEQPDEGNKDGDNELIPDDNELIPDDNGLIPEDNGGDYKGFIPEDNGGDYKGFIPGDNELDPNILNGGNGRYDYANDMGGEQEDEQKNNEFNVGFEKESNLIPVNVPDDTDTSKGI